MMLRSVRLVCNNPVASWRLISSSYNVTFLPSLSSIIIELNIYGSKVSIVAIDNVKPSEVIIKNEIIANAFKSIFEYLWKSTEK